MSIITNTIDIQDGVYISIRGPKKLLFIQFASKTR